MYINYYLEVHIGAQWSLLRWKQPQWKDIHGRHTNRWVTKATVYSCGYYSIDGVIGKYLDGCYGTPDDISSELKRFLKRKCNTLAISCLPIDETWKQLQDKMDESNGQCCQNHNIKTIGALISAIRTFTSAFEIPTHSTDIRVIFQMCE